LNTKPIELTGWPEYEYLPPELEAVVLKICVRRLGCQEFANLSEDVEGSHGSGVSEAFPVPILDLRLFLTGILNW
jgi:hypothetical protein